jgi:hypothetical protein
MEQKKEKQQMIQYETMLTRLETKNKGNQTDDVITAANRMCCELEKAKKGRQLLCYHIVKIRYNERLMIITIAGS